MSMFALSFICVIAMALLMAYAVYAFSDEENSKADCLLVVMIFVLSALSVIFFFIGVVKALI